MAAHVNSSGNSLAISPSCRTWIWLGRLKTGRYLEINGLLGVLSPQDLAISYAFFKQGLSLPTRTYRSLKINRGIE